MPLRGKNSTSGNVGGVEAMAAAASFVTVDDNSVGQRLDNFLATLLKGVPKSHVYRIVRSGEVRVNKGRIDAAYRLKLDDIVRIPPVRTIEKTANPSIDEAFRAFSAGKADNTRGLALDILFEDDALLAINKPAGMAVHGGSGISFGVIEALRALRPEAKFIELVHRIDRDTSGVLLIAKKRSALTALHAMLRGETSQRVEKHYNALVKGHWLDERRHIRTRLTKQVTASGECGSWLMKMMVRSHTRSSRVSKNFRVQRCSIVKFAPGAPIRFVSISVRRDFRFSAMTSTATSH